MRYWAPRCCSAHKWIQKKKRLSDSPANQSSSSVCPHPQKTLPSPLSKSICLASDMLAWKTSRSQSLRDCGCASEEEEWGDGGCGECYDVKGHQVCRHGWMGISSEELCMCACVQATSPCLWSDARCNGVFLYLSWGKRSAPSSISKHVSNLSISLLQCQM